MIIPGSAGVPPASKPSNLPIIMDLFQNNTFEKRARCPRSQGDNEVRIPAKAFLASLEDRTQRFPGRKNSALPWKKELSAPHSKAVPFATPWERGRPARFGTLYPVRRIILKSPRTSSRILQLTN